MNQKDYYHKLVDRVFNYYGKQCVCCNEGTLEHITLFDSASSEAPNSRRQLLHRAIKNKNRDRYIVLCLNCVKGYREQGKCYHTQ